MSDQGRSEKVSLSFVCMTIVGVICALQAAVDVWLGLFWWAAASALCAGVVFGVLIVQTRRRH